MHAYVVQAKEFVYASPLAEVPLLARFVASLIDLLTGPLTGVRTAYFWPWLLAALVVTALVFVLENRGRSRIGLGTFLKYCFPKALYAHSSTRTDIKIIVANNFLMPFVNLTWRFSAALFTGAILGGMIWLFGEPLKIFQWSFTALVIFTIMLAFAEDLGFYLCHLAHHKIPALWAFHKLHHSAEVLTPLTAIRNHPVEFMLIPPFKAVTGSLLMAPTLFLFDQPPTVVEILGANLASAILGFLGGQLFHSHIWLTWPAAVQRFVMCPAQHQLHHSSAPRHHDKNMAGMFTFWDWVFGTLYIAPREREQFAYGVYGQTKQPHPGLLAAYLVPFWDAVPTREQLARWLPGPLGRAAAALPRLSLSRTAGDLTKQRQPGTS